MVVTPVPVAAGFVDWSSGGDTASANPITATPGACAPEEELPVKVMEVVTVGAYEKASAAVIVPWVVEYTVVYGLPSLSEIALVPPEPLYQEMQPTIKFAPVMLVAVVLQAAPPTPAH